MPIFLVAVLGLLPSVAIGQLAMEVHDCCGNSTGTVIDNGLGDDDAAIGSIEVNGTIGASALVATSMGCNFEKQPAKYTLNIIGSIENTGGTDNIAVTTCHSGDQSPPISAGQSKCSLKADYMDLHSTLGFTGVIADANSGADALCDVSASNVCTGGSPNPCSVTINGTPVFFGPTVFSISDFDLSADTDVQAGSTATYTNDTAKVELSSVNTTPALSPPLVGLLMAGLLVTGLVIQRRLASGGD